MKFMKLEGYKYKLAEDEKVFVDIFVDCHNDYISLDKGILIIKRGYAWDGSSIPLKSFYKWILDSDKYCKEASLVHDAGCQLMREGLMPKTLKDKIDRAYQQRCIQGGMGKRQAGLRYWAISKFGKRYIEKRKIPRNKIYTA